MAMITSNHLSPIYSFAFPTPCALAFSSKYSLTLSLATETTSASSTVGGTLTSAA